MHGLTIKYFSHCFSDLYFFSSGRLRTIARLNWLLLRSYFILVPPSIGFRYRLLRIHGTDGRWLESALCIGEDYMLSNIGSISYCLTRSYILVRILGIFLQIFSSFCQPSVHHAWAHVSKRSVQGRCIYFDVERYVGLVKRKFTD